MRASAIFTCLIMLWAFPTISRADTWLKAEIYFIDWDVSTRLSLSPEKVRELAHAKHTLRADSALNLANSILSYDLKPSKNHSPEDARLVIDLYSTTGARTTYYASRFHLCSLDNTLKRRIDEKFRDYFRNHFQHLSISRPN